MLLLFLYIVYILLTEIFCRSSMSTMTLHAKDFPGQVEIIDLRTLFPLDEELIFQRVKEHGKCLVLTEEQQYNSFAEALAGRISAACFSFLDSPVAVMGALNTPAIPLNMELEKAILPNAKKVSEKINQLLSY